MNDTTPRPGHYPFVLGLVTGTFVGAGLAAWLAPRVAEKYRQANTTVAEVVDNLTQRAHGVRDDISDAVAHGAHAVADGALEVERMATAARPRAVNAKSSM